CDFSQLATNAPMAFQPAKLSRAPEASPPALCETRMCVVSALMAMRRLRLQAPPTDGDGGTILRSSFNKIGCELMITAFSSEVDSFERMRHGEIKMAEQRDDGHDTKQGHWAPILGVVGSPLRLFALAVLVCTSVFACAAAALGDPTTFMYC